MPSVSSDVGCVGRNQVPNRPAVLLKIYNYIYISISMFLYTFIYITCHGNYQPRLDIRTRRVVTKTEGRTSGDTAATTSSLLRRSDRGGFPYDILYCICMITLARVGRRF